MIAVHWNGASVIRTRTTFLLDRLATYSDTITAMHHITAYHGQTLKQSVWVDFHFICFRTGCNIQISNNLSIVKRMN